MKLNERDEAFEKWTQSGVPVSLHSAFHAHDAEIADLQRQLRERELAITAAEEAGYQNAVMGRFDIPTREKGKGALDAYVQEKVDRAVELLARWILHKDECAICSGQVCTCGLTEAIAPFDAAARAKVNP